MKRRHIFQLCLALLLCCPLLLKAQSSQTNYQYWIDDNKDEAVYGIADGEEIVLDIDVGSLSPGVHFYNIRAYDTVGSKRKWGTTYRYLFCIPQDVQASPKDLASYEYWIDNDYEHRVTTAVSGDKKEALLAIDVSNLSPGVHFYNMRAQDEDGSWGAVLRQVFCIPKQQKADVHRLITGYSYSFDGITPTNVVFDSPIEEYTLIKSFDIPSCHPPKVIDDDCSFVFDEDKEVANVIRNINVSFSLFFKDQNGAISSPATTDFLVQDVQSEAIQTVTIPATAAIPGHLNGGFSVVRFEVPETMNLNLSATGNCSIRLYSPYSQLLDSYDGEALTIGVTKEFEEGTYFAVVFGNSEGVTLSLNLADMDALKPTIAFDMDSHVVSISCKAEGATIFYTIDGTTPTAESTLYKEPFVLDKNCTVKAIATWSGAFASPVATMGIDIFDVATPVIAHDGKSITITCATEGAIIYYTLDGTEPTTESTIYVEPFIVSDNCTIKAIAIKEGWHDSQGISYSVNWVKVCGYAILDSSTGTLTFKYGPMPSGDNVWETENTEFTYYIHGAWISDDLKTVVFDESYAKARPKSTAWWFVLGRSIKEFVGMENLNTSEVTDMTGMFYQCEALTSLDLSSFNTSNVHYMRGMFEGCRNLETIYVGEGWSTESVVDSQDMFAGCVNLVGCQGTKYDSYYVDKTYARMDDGLRAPGYLTPKGYVKPTPDPSWQAYAALNEDKTVLTFYYDANKSSRNGMEIGPFVSSQYRAWDSYALTKIKTVVFDDSFANYHPTSTSAWFWNCCVLKEIVGIKNLKTDKVTNMRGMFGYCISLEYLDLSSFDTRNVTDMSCMFDECSSLKYLNLSSFNTSKVTSMYSMFVSCSSLEGLDISNFDTKNVGNMNYVFSRCAALRSLDISSFNTSKVTEMFQMFNNCKSLRKIYVGDGWNTSRVTNSFEMLANCLRLKGGKGTKYNSLITDGKYARVDGRNELPGYFTYKNESNMISGYAQLDESTATLTFRYGQIPQGENVFDVNATHYDIDNPAPWDNSRLKEIVIDPTFASAFPVSTAYWFFGASHVKEINGIENLNTTNVRDMNYMFASCQSLECLNLSNMVTYRVLGMHSMFKDCNQLSTIYVGDHWNTDNLLNNDGIFDGCNSLIGYKGTSYNASYVDKAYAIVDGGTECPGYLTPMSRGYALFDETTGTLTFKYGVMPKRAYYDSTEKNYIYRADRISRAGTVGTYWHHNKIKHVVFEESFSAARPKSTAEWFFNNTTITSIVGLEYLNTSEVEDMGCMFYNCSGLKDLDVSHFNTSNVRSMDCLFYGCSNLTSLDVSKFKMDSVITTNAMFYNCKSLQNLDVSHFATQNVDNMSFMFAYCSGLTSLDVSRFDTRNVTSMNTMFQMCTGLKSLDVSHFDTGKVTNMGYLFNVCSGLRNINLRNFDTSNVTNIRCMFQSCSGLRDLDLSAFDTQNVTITDSIFGNCQNLKTIYVGDNWTMDNVSSSKNMFLLCTNIVGENGTTYNSSCVDKTYARIDGGTTAPGYLTYKSSDGIPGDVNGDAVVDVEDIVGIVNYILNEPADGFIEANADVSGDGKIDVDDVVATVNIILDSNPASAPQMRQTLIKYGFRF